MSPNEPQSPPATLFFVHALFPALTRSAGGWDPQTEKISDDLAEHVNQAFSNVELTLKHAGGKGWSQVYKSRMVRLPLSETLRGDQQVAFVLSLLPYRY